MAFTGQQFIDMASQHLGKVTPGGSANANQSAQFLLMLQQMMANWQARGIGGATVVTALAANVTTITITSTAIAPVTTLGTANTYPTGWDDAITLNLAVLIAGAWGTVDPDRLAWVKSQADITLQAITPPKGQ